MNSPLPAPAPAQRSNWTRRLVNLLVALVVIAVAAAAFVFSYDGVHAIALLGGMSKQLARYYPGLFDAVLVIACVAAVTLRDGRWWARLWAWAVVFIVLAAIGAADVLHAGHYTLPHRTTEAIVAAAPVVAVLLAFSLLLTLLRPYRTDVTEPVLTPLLEVPALPAAVSAPPIALPAASVPLAAPAAAPAEDVRAAEDVAAAEDRPATAPDVAPTREEPVFAAAPEVPQAAAPGPAHPATAPNQVIAAAGPPTLESPAPESPALEQASREAASGEAAAAPDAPAPPTVVVPALSPESPVEAPAEAPTARGAHGIRYAGNGVPGMAAKQQAEEDEAVPGEEDYWGNEEAGQLAGLVYRAGDDRAGADDTGNSEEAEAGGAAGADDAEGDEPAARKNPPELDDDAPPFATAPFAAVPRLNRVRSTPTPPADEEE